MHYVQTPHGVSCASIGGIDIYTTESVTQRSLSWAASTREQHVGGVWRLPTATPTVATSHMFGAPNNLISLFVIYPNGEPFESASDATTVYYYCKAPLPPSLPPSLPPPSDERFDFMFLSQGGPRRSKSVPRSVPRAFRGAFHGRSARARSTTEPGVRAVLRGQHASN